MSVLNDGWIVAFGFSPGPAEMLVILGIALMLYGGRLPEMARSWGKTLAEFRRSLSGIQNDLNDAMYSPTKNQIDYYPELSPYSGNSEGPLGGEVEQSDDEEGSLEEETTVDTEILNEPPQERPSTAETD